MCVVPHLYGTTSPFSSSWVPFITDVGKARQGLGANMHHEGVMKKKKGNKDREKSITQRKREAYACVQYKQKIKIKIKINNQRFKEGDWNLWVTAPLIRPLIQACPPDTCSTAGPSPSRPYKNITIRSISYMSTKNNERNTCSCSVWFFFLSNLWRMNDEGTIEHWRNVH